ncbi:bridge-like lipid transfer protein family member 1 [Paroedura picta]|uniref:bridge-like lipid transfer protein family member 1 n=1 Tax=Paroedura picta TaxID=143630 RepID=UPI004055C72D
MSYQKMFTLFFLLLMFSSVADSPGSSLVSPKSQERPAGEKKQAKQIDYGRGSIYHSVERPLTTTLHGEANQDPKSLSMRTHPSLASFVSDLGGEDDLVIEAEKAPENKQITSQQPVMNCYQNYLTQYQPVNWSKKHPRKKRTSLHQSLDQETVPAFKTVKQGLTANALLDRGMQFTGSTSNTPYTPLEKKILDNTDDETITEEWTLDHPISQTRTTVIVEIKGTVDVVLTPLVAEALDRYIQAMVHCASTCHPAAIVDNLHSEVLREAVQNRKTTFSEKVNLCLLQASVEESTSNAAGKSVIHVSLVALCFDRIATHVHMNRQLDLLSTATPAVGAWLVPIDQVKSSLNKLETEGTLRVCAVMDCIMTEALERDGLPALVTSKKGLIALAGQWMKSIVVTPASKGVSLHRPAQPMELQSSVPHGQEDGFGADNGGGLQSDTSEDRAEFEFDAVTTVPSDMLSEHPLLTEPSSVSFYNWVSNAVGNRGSVVQESPVTKSGHNSLPTGVQSPTEPACTVIFENEQDNNSLSRTQRKRSLVTSEPLRVTLIVFRIGMVNRMHLEAGIGGLTREAELKRIHGSFTLKEKMKVTTVPSDMLSEHPLLTEPSSVSFYNWVSNAVGNRGSVVQESPVTKSGHNSLPTGVQSPTEPACTVIFENEQDNNSLSRTQRKRSLVTSEPLRVTLIVFRIGMVNRMHLEAGIGGLTREAELKRIHGSFTLKEKMKVTTVPSDMLSEHPLLTEPSSVSFYNWMSNAVGNRGSVVQESPVTKSGHNSLPTGVRSPTESACRVIFENEQDNNSLSRTQRKRSLVTSEPPHVTLIVFRIGMVNRMHLEAGIGGLTREAELKRIHGSFTLKEKMKDILHQKTMETSATAHMGGVNIVLLEGITSNIRTVVKCSIAKSQGLHSAPRGLKTNNAAVFKVGALSINIPQHPAALHSMTVRRSHQLPKQISVLIRQPSTVPQPTKEDTALPAEKTPTSVNQTPIETSAFPQLPEGLEKKPTVLKFSARIDGIAIGASLLPSLKAEYKIGRMRSHGRTGAQTRFAFELPNHRLRCTFKVSATDMSSIPPSASLNLPPVTMSVKCIMEEHDSYTDQTWSTDELPTKQGYYLQGNSSRCIAEKSDGGPQCGDVHRLRTVVKCSIAKSQALHSAPRGLKTNNAAVFKVDAFSINIPQHPAALHSMTVRSSHQLSKQISDLIRQPSTVPQPTKGDTAMPLPGEKAPTSVNQMPTETSEFPQLPEGLEKKPTFLKFSARTDGIAIGAALLPSLKSEYKMGRMRSHGRTGAQKRFTFDLPNHRLRCTFKVSATDMSSIPPSASLNLPPVTMSVKCIMEEHDSYTDQTWSIDELSTKQGYYLQGNSSRCVAEKSDGGPQCSDVHRLRTVVKCTIAKSQALQSAPRGLKTNNDAVFKVGALSINIPQHPATLHSMTVQSSHQLSKRISDLIRQPLTVPQPTKEDTATPLPAEKTPTSVNQTPIQTSAFPQLPEGLEKKPVLLKFSARTDGIAIGAALLPSLKSEYKMGRMRSHGRTGAQKRFTFELPNHRLRCTFKVSATDMSSIPPSASLNLPPVTMLVKCIMEEHDSYADQTWSIDELPTKLGYYLQGNSSRCIAEKSDGGPQCGDVHRLRTVVKCSIAKSQALHSAPRGLKTNNAAVFKVGALSINIPQHPAALHSMTVWSSHQLPKQISDLIRQPSTVPQPTKEDTAMPLPGEKAPTSVNQTPTETSEFPQLPEGLEKKPTFLKFSARTDGIPIGAALLPSLKGEYKMGRMRSHGRTGAQKRFTFESPNHRLRCTFKVSATDMSSIPPSASLNLPPVTMSGTCIMEEHDSYTDQTWSIDELPTKRGYYLQGNSSRCIAEKSDGGPQCGDIHRLRTVVKCSTAKSQALHSPPRGLKTNNAAVFKVGALSINIPQHPAALHSMTVQSSHQLSKQISDLIRQPPTVPQPTKEDTATPLPAEKTPTCVNQTPIETSEFPQLPEDLEKKPIVLKFSARTDGIAVGASLLPSLKAEYKMGRMRSHGRTGAQTRFTFELSYQRLRCTFKVSATDMSSIPPSASLNLPPVTMSGTCIMEEHDSYTDQTWIIDELSTKQGYYLQGNSSRCVAEVGSFEHNLTTDLLNHLVFVQKVFMKELNEVIQMVSGVEQPSPLWNEHDGTTDGEKPKILLYSFSLQFKGIRVTATTPSVRAVRFETGLTELELSNRIQTKAVSGSSSSLKLFGKCQVDLNPALGQTVKHHVYEEAGSDFHQVASFKTGIGLRNALREEIGGSSDRAAVLITLNRPVVFAQPVAFDRAVLFWLNYKAAYDNWSEQRLALRKDIHKATKEIVDMSPGIQQTSAQALGTLFLQLTVTDLGICLPITSAPQLHYNSEMLKTEWPNASRGSSLPRTLYKESKLHAVSTKDEDIGQLDMQDPLEESTASLVSSSTFPVDVVVYVRDQMRRKTARLGGSSGAVEVDDTVDGKMP